MNGNDNIIITDVKWAVFERRIVNTPQGQMMAEVPLVFRSVKEVQRYIAENYEAANQIVLSKISFTIDAQIQYFYPAE